MTQITVPVEQLSGVLLDYFVAVEEGHEPFLEDDGVYVFNSNDDDRMYAFRPSINWDCAGPIIERENINLVKDFGDPTWYAGIENSEEEYEFIGEDNSMLIAAMRCYVASKLGDTVTIPAELAHLWEGV